MYLVPDLTAGTSYTFKVRARNEFGFGDFSQEVLILCAFAPEPPGTVTTANSNSDIVISWSEPELNGLLITEYTILIQKSDYTYTTDLMYCNGALHVIVSTRTCTVPLSSLQVTPYNLVFGDHINVIVVSTNEYGSSQYSEVGNGATIWVVPDAP